MVATNSLNINSSGVVSFNNATGVFTESALTQHDVLIGGASNAIVSVAPSATSGVPLVSAGAAANPVFGTAVVAGGGTGLATLTTYELMASGTTATGNMQQVPAGTSGQVLFSNGAGALPSFGAAPAGVAWVDVTSGTQTIAVSTGYVTDNATIVTYTLPASPAFGSVFEITGGASAAATSPWILNLSGGQSVQLGNTSATTAVAATLQYDSIRAVCVVAGASSAWVILSSVGNPILT